MRDSAEVDQTNEESQQQMPSKLGQATQFDNSNPTEAVAPAGEAARPIQEESQPADAVGVPVEVIPEPAAQAQEHLPERSAKGQKPSSGDAATDEAAGSAAKACSQEGHSLVGSDSDQAVQAPECLLRGWHSPVYVPLFFQSAACTRRLGTPCTAVHNATGSASAISGSSAHTRIRPHCLWAS